MIILLYLCYQNAQFVAEENIIKEASAANARIQAEELKNSCESDLNSALPEYYASIAALDSLDKRDIYVSKYLVNTTDFIHIESICRK